jgi:hypothetical protein
MFIEPEFQQNLALRKSEIGLTLLKGVWRSSGAKNSFLQHEL